MSDVTRRLLDCFEIVFPDSDVPITTEIRRDSMERWDSMATVTLVGVIEEEFDITFEAEELEAFTSFQAVIDVVSRKVQGR